MNSLQSTNLIEYLIHNYQDILDIEKSIIMIGQLEHRHSHGRMRAVYTLSEQGQYGYAYLNNDQAVSTFQVDERASHLLEGSHYLATKLAILDSLWNNTVIPKEVIHLSGKTPQSRNQIRNDNILDAILRRPKEEPIVMIGFFNALYERLIQAGRRVFCCDADIGMTCDIDKNSNALLIASASYLTRDDSLSIHKAVRQSSYSILISQTCSNMVKMHFDFGFDLIFSESFPTYSLANSTMGIYHQ
ncbi:MAG: hypothetical protein H0U73_11350 [Tatlockia sp.]|nr:hypothetical protein [Tatlockia sp.]